MINRYIDICFIGLCTIVIGYVSIYYLSDPYLWYDEAGQFWIAKGLNHYSEPLSQPQGIIQVIENNRHYNMDPGGFSILLHYWTMVSNYHIWLRLLPWIFFCGFCVVLYKVVSHFTLSRCYALFCSTLPFILPVLSARVVELRAYSMEMFGTITATYIFIKSEKNSSRKAFLLSLFFAVFCTVRYSFILVALALSLYWLYLMINEGGKYICAIVFFCLPLLFVVGCIYYYMMQIQNANATPAYYLLQDYILYNPKILFSPFSLIFYLVITLSIYQYKNKGQIDQLHLCTLLVSTTFFLTSTIGKFPWDYHRDISVTILFYATICIDLYSFLSKRGYYTHLSSLIALFVVFMIFLPLRDRIHNSLVQVQVQEFEKFTQNEHYKKMYVDYSLNPTLRHLYEYGLYKNSFIYPDGFVFQKGSEHTGNFHNRKSSAINNKDCDVYFLVHSNLQETATPSGFSSTEYKHIYPYKHFYYKIKK